MDIEEQLLEKIENMNHAEMEWFHRNASSGHPFFKNDRVGNAFQSRFQKLGGMTTEFSKKINSNRDA